MGQNNNEIKLFEKDKIRAIWDCEAEEYYISVIDVVEVLTESKHPLAYWSKLKNRLNEESCQPFPFWKRLKIPDKEGKMCETDVISFKHFLRLIQSIPSSKAEPLKEWLAQLGQERIDEMADPEKIIERAIGYYRGKGHSEEWISRRFKTIEVRKDLIHEWKKSGVETRSEQELLTDIIIKEWSGKTIKEYKKYKGLRNESLRDNMTNTELILNSLAEVSATEISRNECPKGFDESRDVAKSGGAVANVAREALEKQLGRKVISKSNLDNLQLSDSS